MTDPDLVPMPEDLYGIIRNGSNEPCDMAWGPCACGGWHNLEEWADRSKRENWPSWVMAQLASRIRS